LRDGTIVGVVWVVAGGAGAGDGERERRRLNRQEPRAPQLFA